MTLGGQRLRRLGYRVRVAPATDLRTLLETAGVRLAPLDRLRPQDGHWYGPCPVCHREAALWLEPGQRTYRLLCSSHAGEGNAWSLLALLLRMAR